MNLNQKLNAIRALLDTDVKDVDMDSIKNKGLSLTQMIGLSAECKAEARKNLEKARLTAIKALRDDGITPSVLMKMVDGSCADELSAFEYADRLNAGITHQLDFLRSVISLHKQEMQSSIS